MNNSIQPFIYRRVVVLDQTIPVKTAARAMSEQQVGCVVVGDKKGHIIGIVTDRDLCCGILGFGLPEETAVSEVMSPLSVWATALSKIPDVVKMMETNGVRRIPVIEASDSGVQKCIGIVALDDLILANAITLEQLSRVIRSQVHRHARKPPLPHEDRREHTLNHFNTVLSEAMEIEKPIAGNISLHLLKVLVRRLPCTTAAHLIAQLPSLLQEDLLALPAGPDRALTRSAILTQFENEFGYSASWTETLIRGFWKGLRIFLKDAELRQVSVQLPPDLRALFTGNPETPENPMERHRKSA